MSFVITATCAGFSKSVCAPKLELITGRSWLFDIEIDSIARISSSAGRDVSRDAVPRSVELPQTGANDRVQPVIGSAVCGSRFRRGCEIFGRPAARYERDGARRSASPSRSPRGSRRIRRSPRRRSAAPPRSSTFHLTSTSVGLFRLDALMHAIARGSRRGSRATQRAC